MAGEENTKNNKTMARKYITGVVPFFSQPFFLNNNFGWIFNENLEMDNLNPFFSFLFYSL